MTGPPGKVDWVDGKVTYAKGDTLDVEVEGSPDPVSTPVSKVKAMHPTSADGVEDMIMLSDLFEGSLLRNLRTRYNKDQIYVSSVSSPVVVVSVNSPATYLYKHPRRSPDPSSWPSTRTSPCPSTGPTW